MRGKNLLVLPTIALIAAVFLAGCESTGPKTKTGAVAGGLLGAVGGGIIGHQSGHGLEGAAIGAGVGVLSGGLVGRAMDKKDQEAMAVNPNHLPLTEIARMAKEGTPDAVIISEIERTNSLYKLNSEIITYLKESKVSDRVVDYMLNSAKAK